MTRNREALLHPSTCAACGEPVSYTDEGGCVGTDPGGYHFKAECLLEAVRRENAEVERLREALPARSDLREIADALETAYGCLDLIRSSVKPVDLEDCIVEVKAAREKALDLMERAA